MKSILKISILSLLTVLLLIGGGCAYYHYHYSPDHLSLVGEWNISVADMAMQGIFEGTDVEGKTVLVIGQDTRITGDYEVQENLITFSCTGKVGGQDRSYQFKGTFTDPQNIGGTVRITSGPGGESETGWEGLKH